MVEADARALTNNIFRELRDATEPHPLAYEGMPPVFQPHPLFRKKIQLPSRDISSSTLEQHGGDGARGEHWRL